MKLEGRASQIDVIINLNPAITGLIAMLQILVQILGLIQEGKKERRIHLSKGKR